MKKDSTQLAYLAAFLPTSVSLFLYGYLGSYTRFIADDYCSATYAQTFGLVKSILYWYRTWSGRYAAFGMDWLVLTKLFGRYHIQLVPPLTLVLWLIFTSGAIHLYLKSIAPERNALLAAIALATCLIYLIMVFSPNLPQSFYWWNGMRSYTLPLVVLTAYAFVFQLVTKQIRAAKQLIFWGIVSFLLLFASGGLSETYVVLQFVLLAFLLILKIIPLRNKKADPQFVLLLAGFLGTILSLLVIISAPGNAIRQSRLDTSFNLVNLIGISLSGYTKFILDTFNQANKWTGLFGVVSIWIWTGLHYKRPAIQLWKIIVYFIVGFALSFVCILPGVYGYAQMPPARTMILPVFILVVFLLVSSFLMGNWFANKFNIPAWNKNGLLGLASVFLILSSATTSLSLYNSRGAYVAFARKWDSVDVQILQAKGKESVEIPDMTNWSGLDRPVQDPGFWLNECYSDLYGIEVIGPPFLWQ